MKTTRELCLERLSTAAATAGEERASVLELVTFFNTYFEERCPVAEVDQDKPPRVTASIMHTAEALVPLDASHPCEVDDASVHHDQDCFVECVIPVKEGKAAREAARSWREAARMALAAVTRTLSPTARFRQLFAISRFATITGIKAAQRVYFSAAHRDGASAVDEVNHEHVEMEDQDLAVLLRFAIDLDDAAARTTASYALWQNHKKQLNEVCARLSAVRIAADASPASCRLLEKLTAIAGALESTQLTDSAIDMVDAWV